MAKNEKRTRTEIRWRVDTDETDDGRLTSVTLTRHAYVYPLTSDGRQLWSQGEHTTETFGPIAADEIPSVLSSLSEMLVYYASGDRGREQA